MASKKTKESSVTFHNKISSSFREVHVDGAFGGLTPRGYINMNFYAERFPIPKSSDFKIEKLTVGEKIKDSDDSKSGVLREYEFGVYMDIFTAKDVVRFLNSKITELETLLNKKHGSTSEK